MFNNYRMLSLPLKKVWIVKIISSQIPITQWKKFPRSELPVLSGEQFPSLLIFIPFLKLVSAIFHFFAKWYPWNNNEKCFLFHLKSSTSSWGIYVLVFPSSPLWPLLIGWSKINLKAYDVINCPLITYFVWCFDNEKGMRVECCQLIDYLIRNIFMKKSWSGKILQKRYT